MVSAFADTTFTFETDPAFNFEMNDKDRSKVKTHHSHNVNNTATTNIHGG